jgi:hypothetical protein
MRTGVNRSRRRCRKSSKRSSLLWRIAWVFVNEAIMRPVFLEIRLILGFVTILVEPFVICPAFRSHLFAFFFALFCGAEPKLYQTPDCLKDVH